MSQARSDIINTKHQVINTDSLTIYTRVYTYTPLMCVNLLLMLQVQCHSLDGGVYDSLLDRSSWLLLDPRWPTCCIQNEGAALCIKSICEQIYIAHMYTTAHALSWTSGRLVLAALDYGHLICHELWHHLWVCAWQHTHHCCRVWQPQQDIGQRGHFKPRYSSMSHLRRATMSLALALSSPQTQGKVFSEPIFLRRVAALLPWMTQWKQQLLWTVMPLALFQLRPQLVEQTSDLGWQLVWALL